jgi:hypothetical protein
VGTLVAAISGVGLLLTGIVILLRRRRLVAMPAMSHELSNDHTIVETSSAEKQSVKELWGGHAAVEIGRNSQFESSVESLVILPPNSLGELGN